MSHLFRLTLSLGLLGLVVGCSPTRPLPDAPQVDIELASGTETEQTGADQLRRILNTYDTERWTYTRRVRIQDRAVPHSHPVLTLNTRSLDDDHAQLATFLHEQFHWFIETRPDALDAAIDDLRAMYPDVPVGRPDGARDEESTYYHLIVCWLEFEKLASLVGEAEARRVLESYTHYQWIYERVLADTDAIASVAAAHGLDAPEITR